MDIEEIKEMLYPESRIKPEFVKEVQKVEKEMALGKVKKFSSKKEVTDSGLKKCKMSYQYEFSEDFSDALTKVKKKDKLLSPFYTPLNF